ncbi:MAG: imidazolonepropionase [Candidatus Kapaibacterium sp.]|nr:MAG: imidazolonepropionase [Candidatus Kapabacteria bacterium]
MSLLLTNISELVTVHTPQSGRKTGASMGQLGIISNAAMLVEERIIWIGTQAQADRLFRDRSIERYDCRGRAVMPGFVDSHTHMVFAGNRADEFSQRIRGVSYQQIAARGGGIMATVRATRAASEEELYTAARQLVFSALRHGTTTLEIKTGYGLSVESELKMLRVIAQLAATLPVRIVATLLGAHAVPPEFAQRRDDYIAMLCTELIPEVGRAGLARFCDVFADEGYFTAAEAERILTAGLDWGLQPKIHADEFADVGAASVAIAVGAASADHLLHINPAMIPEFARWRTVATLLPGTAYTLRLPMPPARALIDAGATVALATDCNPGSCLTENIQMVLSLAVQLGGMTIEEAVTAATAHGAAALLLEQDVGSIQVGKYADFLILDSPSIADLVYHFGTNRVAEVWIGGRCVANNSVGNSFL